MNITTFSIALLILQPLIFFRRILINPEFHIPYDIEGFHLPLAAYLAQCLRRGVAPFWDPWSFSGTPFHADLTTQVFYPFTLLAVWAGNLSQGRNLFYWIEALVPLHMILAGLFCFALLRRMGLNRPASLLGASVYQLGGFFASQAQHLGAVSTAAWLPLAVLAAYELRLRWRARWVAILALAVGMAVLSGFAATMLVFGVAVFLVAAGWLITRESGWWLAPGLAAGFLGGAAIAAVELIPLWTLTKASIASSRPQALTLGGGLPLESLASLIVPDYYHIFEPGSLYKLPYNFTFLYVYCGIVTVGLILLAPFIRTRRAILFLTLTVFSAFWMLGEHTPVYRNVFRHLPDFLRGALYAEEALMAFSFFAAITAAVALQRFDQRVAPVLLWTLVLFTSWDLIHTGAARPMNTARGGARNDQSWYRSVNQPVADKLHALNADTKPPSRVDYTDESFSQGVLGAAMLGIPTTSGNNPFELSRVLDVRRLYATGSPTQRNVFVSRVDSPLLNMLNVSLLAGAAPIPAEQINKAGLQFLDAVNGISIYRNPHALPRFFLVPRIRRSPNETETLRLLSEPSFNPSEEAIVEGVSGDRDGFATGEVRVISYDSNRVQLMVTAAGPAFLVTSEAMYPGWQATVNGAAHPLLMSNGAFRGLALPAGASRVVMEYRPLHFAFSLWLSILSCLSAVVVAIVSEWNPRTTSARIAERMRGVRVGLQGLFHKCAVVAVARRRAIGSVSLILLVIVLFYWKIVFTSQSSLLTGTETVNGSFARLQFWIFSIRHDIQPLWDPFTFGGHSSAGEAGAFYPLHLLLALAPLGRDGVFSPHLYHLWFVLAHVLGACFLFALAREFGLTRFAAFAGAICFSGGGFMGSNGDLFVLESAVWLPLMLLFLLRAVHAPEFEACIWNALMSGLAMGMSLLAGSGDIAMLQVLVIVTAALAAAKTFLRAGLIAGAAIVMGLAAGALHWLPALGARPAEIANAAGELTANSIVALVAPGAFGGAAVRGATIYFGIFPLLLAVIAVWRNWRNSWVRYLTWLAIAAFLCALGPRYIFQGLFSSVLQGLWIQDASRFAYLFGFAGSLLVAFGTESLLSAAEGEAGWSKLNNIVVAAAGVCGAGLLFAAFTGAQELNPELSLSFLLILLSAGLSWYVLNGERGRWARTLMLALIFFDLSAFDRLARSRQELAATQGDALDRLFTFRGAAEFLKGRRPMARVEIPSGPALNFGDVFGIETIDNGEKRPDLWNFHYRALPAATDQPGALYQDLFWKIYEVPAMPRAWTVHQAFHETSRDAQLAGLNAPGFDLWQMASADRDLKLEPAVPNRSDFINFFESHGNQVEVEAFMTTRGLLVLSERFAPGWHATVNGNRAPIIRVDGDLRGIVLDRGQNQIVLDYFPWPLYIAWPLTFAAFLGPFAYRRFAGRP